MAVTKIWSVKGSASKAINYVENEEKTENPKYTEVQRQALEDVIDYAANEDKTEQHFFVSAINCNTTCAKDQFRTIKNQFGKDDGIVAFHGYQSFAECETTPEVAHKIGVELAEKLWGDRFQVVVATHLNSRCLHNHFVLNSVSFKDGMKFHSDGAFYHKMKSESDAICRAYGLSVVENIRGVKDPSYLHRAELEGLPTRYSVARAAIDEAISKSCNMKEFELNLKAMGYTTQFNPKRKYWTVTPKGWSKPIRLKNLGEDYTNERIRERVSSNPMSVRLYAFHETKKKGNRYKLPTRKKRIKKVGGLRGLYLRYCYELGYLPKYTQRPNRIHPALKEDLIKCEQFSKQVRLLEKYQIDSVPELRIFIDEKEEQMKYLSTKRDELRKRLRRNIPYEEKQKIRKQITEITSRLAELRKETKSARDIEARNGDIAVRIEVIDKEAEKEINKERDDRK